MSDEQVTTPVSADFASNLRAQLEAQPRLRLRGRRLLKLLNEPDSDQKAARLTKLEAHARVHLGMDATASINWASVDWPTIIGDLLKFLMTILPLILGA